MVHIMDSGIGRVLAALEATGQCEETIVFFLSDNGGPTSANASSNAPLRGFKSDVFEGGVRVPFIVSWPGILPGGSVYGHPVISLDVARTALVLGQAKIVPKLEGTGLMPFLRGEVKEPPHEALFWLSGNKWAARRSDWKLLLEKGMTEPKLYQLNNDIGEKNDRSSSGPDRVKKLRAEYQAWNKDNLPALFPSYREYHEKKRQFYKEGL